MVCINQVGNKYQIAEETTYGTLPSPFTSLDYGQVQTVSVTEEENIEKLSSINGGHTANRFEDGLYFTNVSINTRVTKASMPNLLKACFGGYSDDGTDYTVTSTPVSVSHSLKVTYDATSILEITGLVVKDFEFSFSKGEIVSCTMNCLAKKVIKKSETLTVTANSDPIFKDLDTAVTIGGNGFVLNSASISGNWNVTDDEGRGIESVPEGERRLLQRVCWHNFDVSGSYEAEFDDNLEVGYTDERSDESIVFTMSRGTDNEHVFTLSQTRSSSRGYEFNTDNARKVESFDYEALDCVVTGDL